MEEGVNIIGPTGRGKKGLNRYLSIDFNRYTRSFQAPLNALLSANHSDFYLNGRYERIVTPPRLSVTLTVAIKS